MADDKQLKEFKWPLNGRLITKLDGSVLPDGHFQRLQNMSYNDGGIEGIAGMSKINTSALFIPILIDGSFENWSSTTTLIDWTLTGASATLAREGTTIKDGYYSAKVTRVGNDCKLYQDVQNASDQTIDYWQTKIITLGCWVYATVASRAYIYIADGVGTTESSAHSGTPGWEYLTVTRTIDAAATYVHVGGEVKTGNTTAYFDISQVIEGNAVWDGNNGLAYLQSFSSTTKTQGTYALKGIAVATNSLRLTLTRTGVIANLTDVDTIQFDIRASRTGSNLKIGIHDLGGTTTEITPVIAVTDTYQTVSWNISTVANANKDFIDQIIVTVLDATAINTFYIDNFKVT